MSFLNIGAQWLERMRAKHLTISVWYKRGDKQIGIPATPGRTVFKTVDDYGRFVYVESRDFLVKAGDIAFDDGLFAPQPGDQIIEGNEIFEIMAPAGEPPWRYSDINRQRLRIHTKNTGQTND